MNKLIRKTELQRHFQWKDRTGKLWTPASMTTRHLFYTIRMVWNHTMPVQARSPTYIRYIFKEFYTPEYMAKAIQALAAELLKRNDIEPAWEAEIIRWRKWFSNRLKLSGG